MKDTLVLVPGLLCTERLWQHQVLALKDDFEIIVADVSKDDSMDGFTKRILDEAPQTFHLAGLSMGGYVALEVVRQAPERVARLALLDTSARPDTEEQTKLRLALVEKAKREGTPAVATELIPRLVHESRTDDAELADAVIEMAKETGVSAFEHQETAIITRADSRPLLGKIPCPTLILCGREDIITPLEVSEELAERIPRSELRVIEKCGHLSTMERPGEVSAALREFFRGR